MMILGLALKDLRHDFGASLGLCVALAAVLAPLLLLDAVKSGITGALLDELRRDPGTLQLQFLNDMTITPEMLAQIEAMPGVGFVAPMGRQIAETVEITTPELRSEPATLQSSGPGDPLLGTFSPPDPAQIVLSQQLGQRLVVEAGETTSIVMSNRRTGDEFVIEVSVIGISDALPGRFVLAHPDLTLAVQAVAAGTAVPGFDIPGTPPVSTQQDVARLRMYAATLGDVGPLTSALQRLGFIIGSEGGKIDGILRLEKNLNWLMGAIVTLAGLGYTLALSVSLWVNVQRKRKSLAMLRLMGLKTRDMVLYPLIQATCVAGIGTLLAIGVTLVIGAALNIQFDGSLPSGADIAQITAKQGISVLLATVLVSVVSGSFAGFSISRLQPKEALRDV